MSSAASSVDDDDEDDDAPNSFGANASDRCIFSYGRSRKAKSYASIAGYDRPWRFIEKKRSGISQIFYARWRDFRIILDVTQFAPENIVVNIVGDVIVIEAHQPLMDDYLGRAKRQLVRKYKTPPDLKLNTVTGRYKGGFLTLHGERNLDMMYDGRTSDPDFRLEVTDEHEDAPVDESEVVSRESSIDGRKLPDD